jgi:hypothetical protein
VPLISTLNPKLEVRLSGPAVRPGRLAARDLAELARLLDQAVVRVGRVLSRGRGPGARPRARDLEAACRLYLVRWADGSAVAGFDVAEPRAEMASLAHIGEQSLHHLAAGLAQIAAEAPVDMPLPDGFDDGVLETCAALGKLLDHGIGAMMFTEPSRRQGPSVCYDLSMRERVHLLVDRERTRMPRKDLGLTRPIHIFPTGRGVTAAQQPAEGSFWQSASLEQLAADQAVLPIMNIMELEAIWSEGDVFDDALSELLQDRAERRRRDGRRAH